MAIDRDLYQQQWPAPLAIDATLPQPWYVAGYSHRAVRAVLQSDYGARWRDEEFTVAGGAMTYISQARDLYGARGGTLFVLYEPAGTLRPELERILDVAHGRGLRVETLRARPTDEKPRQP